MTKQTMHRDLVGYGARVPHVQWPNGARVAVQFVINYEEGGEHCILDGDDQSEWLLSDIIGATPYAGVRHMNMESLYEYGSRAGFWRLHRLFEKHQLPCTVFAVALALDKNPDAAKAMVDAGWEVASHGLRWIDYQHMDEEQERQHIAEAVRLHTQATGTRPLGIYQGKPSPNTRRLVIEEGGFEYDADSYGDDLPYWVPHDGGQHLVVPYTLDVNDMRFVTASGFANGDQFFAYLRDAFDCLYAEGSTAPKMMSIGLHCRIIGRPGRIGALERFMEYLAGRKDVWVCRRIDIARHWRAQHHP
ncbi:MAG: allantoinase PuuE [Myxococcota bacterium]|nr:allantoinase PuuE [Myxococcota bacterium]